MQLGKYPEAPAKDVELRASEKWSQPSCHYKVTTTEFWKQAKIPKDANSLWAQKKKNPELVTKPPYKFYCFIKQVCHFLAQK